MGLFDGLFRKKEKRVLRKRPRMRGDQEETYEEEFEGPRERDNETLLVDHHFVYPPEKDFDRHISRMEYIINIENTTDYPMGNIKVEFNKASALGKFGSAQVEKKLLDSGEKMAVRVPFIPSYTAGTDQFEFEIVFFDFKYKVEERIKLTTEPLKVSSPKLEPYEIDNTTYQFLTADLYRWSTESGELAMLPEDLYKSLKQRFMDIGFKEANEMLTEKMFRGIAQMVARDQKGRKWAAQVQVIGKGRQSKLLIYTFAERPQSSYNLAVKALSKMPGKEVIVKSIIT